MKINGKDDNYGYDACDKVIKRLLKIVRQQKYKRWLKLAEKFKEAV